MSRDAAGPVTGRPPLPQPLPPLLVGPTAAGKTAVAILTARAIGAEILSVDSRQIYRGLAIGTAKPTAAERALAEHHLIDLCDPTERMSAARFAELFHAAHEQVRLRGRRALAVGGAGLYVDACLGRLDPLPPADAALRARHLEIEAREGAGALHARLRAIDPTTAGRLAPRDLQRVSRALEVFELSGRPLSDLHASTGVWELAPRGTTMVLLVRERAELYARIEARVAAMLAEGLLEEVAGLLAAGTPADCPAFESIGYGEFARALAGKQTVAEATAAFTLRTRRYARRQMTWFRNRYRGVREVAIPPGEPAARTAERVLAILSP